VSGNELLGSEETLVSFIVPSHNEEATIGCVLDACMRAAASLQPSEVIAAIDCSHDESAEIARALDVKVVERWGSRGSKACVLRTAVHQSSGRYLFFVDADLVGLKAEHLLAIAQPVLSGRTLMAVGTFDYKVGGRVVQRVPWSTGQRILPREVFSRVERRDIHGYNVELMINEEVGRTNGLTASMRMHGVLQRSKAEKHGLRNGAQANFAMWREIADCARHLHMPSYLQFASNVVMMETTSSRLKRQSRTVTTGAALGMRGAAEVLNKVGTRGNSDAASR